MIIIIGIIIITLWVLIVGVFPTFKGYPKTSPFDGRLRTVPKLMKHSG